MRAIRAVLLICLFVGLVDPASAAERRSRVVQFALSTERLSNNLYVSTSDAFTGSTNEHCKQKERAMLGPILAAMAGVFVDWMFDKALASLTERVKKRLAEYSATYSNPAAFADMFRKELWTSTTGGEQSCAVFQRIECNDDACLKGTVGMSVGFIIRRQTTHLELIPYALEVSKPAARHRGGKYAVATQLAIQAPIKDEDAGGAMWSSAQVPIASYGCDIAKGSSNGCFKEFAVDENAWRGASVLPLPPPTVQALIVSVAEVGEPPRGLKGLSSFLETSQGELSDVLSAALKEKLKLSKEK